ncbi:MAG: TetR/AcrR family transcriptional regulator C-terminal domain-containing protein [Acidimicrobiales bacterium]
MTTIERLPLTRDRVARAALEIGDSKGLESITMRGVAAALGVEAMSLYNHVASKEDLLDAVGDVLYAEVLEQHRLDPGRPWQDDARATVAAFRNLVLAHPNVAAILLDRPLLAGSKIAFLQRCHDVFVKAGFSTVDAALEFNTVASWLTGAIRSELGIMRKLEEMGPISREDVPEDYYGAVDFMQSCLAWSADERFEHGFRTVLAGIEQHLRD